MIRTVVLSNPRRTDVERKPSSRQVQARSAMRPEHEIARYDAEQAAHASYIAGQHAHHDATMASGIQTLNSLIPQVKAAAKKHPKERLLGVAMSMVFEADPLWKSTSGDWYDSRMMAEYLVASATGDTSTANNLRPHVMGLFSDARQYAPIRQRYPSVRGLPLENPKEQFRSRRASKRAARGAAATQADLDTHYEQVSHDIAEARQDKMLNDMYRREARLIADTPERDY
jgi:hypothetical protein